MKVGIKTYKRGGLPMIKLKTGRGFIACLMVLSMTACTTDAKPTEQKGSEQSTNSSSESSYPEKQISFTVPTAAGGGVDATARSLMKVLDESNLVEQSMIVENKPGGGMSVGLAEYVTKHSEDPNKLFVASTPIVINHLRKEGNSPHSFNDMTPIAQLVRDYQVVAVKADSKYTDLKSLFDDIKNDPASINIGGGSAPGSLDHLSFMLPASKAGIDVKQIKYIAFDVELMPSLLNGNAHAITTDASSIQEYLKAGKVRVLGVSSPERLEGELKDIPTYMEQGYDIEFTNWRGVFGPKDMDEAALQYWEKKINELSQSEAWKTEVQTKGWTEGYKNASEFKKTLEDQESMIREVLSLLDMAK
jgi:putative tricarboxylic transport membrane protein